MKPTIISFYAGNNYYYECADRLRENCKRLALDCSIEELSIPDGFDWAKICRLKIQFYKKKLHELKTPVLWVDIDSEIKFLPDFMIGNGCDFVAFLRGFNDLSNFDSIRFARTWSPSFLMFNYTPGGIRLVDEMAALESKSVANATDDYFLEEAWRSVGNSIVSLPIPRKFLSLKGDNSESAAFIFGDSGNVAEFKDKVDQHENCRLGDFLASIVAEWIAKVSEQNIRVFLYEKISQYSIRNIDSLVKLARLGKGISPLVALSHAVKASYIYPRKYESRQVIFELLDSMGRKKQARDVLVELANSEYDAWRNQARSKLVEFDMDLRGDEFSASDRVSMWWAKTPYPGNIGDILNPYIIERMTGAPPIFSSRGKGMLAVGSIIKWAEKGTNVWGSGTSRFPEKINPHAVYHAVRGPLTRSAVMANGGYCPAVYGDPALLLPRFYKPAISKKYKIGYIPHYQHSGVEIHGEYKLIDILGVSDFDIHRFIDDVCSCEVIVSTSLHGIIIAHAYGVPAQWAVISGAEKQLHGDNVKFKDYFMGVSMPVQSPIDLSVFGPLEFDRLKEKISFTVDLEFDEKSLLNAFPYQNLLKI